MSSKVHSIRTDQDFVNAEKVATAADFIFKGIHDKAAKRARCASREWFIRLFSVLEGGRQGFSRAQGPERNELEKLHSKAMILFLG